MMKIILLGDEHCHVSMS